VRSRIIWLLAALVIASPASAQSKRLTCESSAAAVVNSLRGAATLRKGQTKERLVEKNARGRLLGAGDQLQVESGGSLVILFCGSRETKEIGQRPPSWYTVPNVPSGTPDPFFAPYRTLLAGRKRALHTAIFSPSDASVVWPETFTVRWSAESNVSPLKLTLAVEMGDDVLWERGGIDSSPGRFTSDDLRGALRKIRDEDPDARLKLSLMTARGEQSSVVFRPLTAESEASLSASLSVADKTAGLLRTFGRADAFAKLQLFSEAAEEFEAELSLSPESVDLITATTLAQCRAGDYARAVALAKRLPSGHPARNKDCLTLFREP
jgi:hypothetical protein